MNAADRTELSRLRQELDASRARIDVLEQQLAEQQSIFDACIDVTGDALFFKDRDSVYRIVNEAFCKAVGKSREESVGKTDYELFPAPEAGSYVDSDREVMRTRQAEIRDWEVSGNNGKLWLHTRKIPVGNEAGEIIGVVCFVRDVTRGKTAELEFERLFNLVPDLVASSTPAGCLTKVNAAWQSTLGYTPEELLSRSGFDLVHPDDTEHSHRELQKILAGGTSRSFVNRFRAKDGSWHWLEWNTIYKSGEALYSIARDITERIRQEEETRLWADAFRYCSHGIAIGLTSTNCILTCNEAFARIHRLGIDEIEGSPILGMYVPEEHDRVVGLLAEADRKGSVSYESRMVRSDGSSFPVQMDIVSILGDQGNPVYRIATVQDITERQHSQMALIESEIRFRSAVESAPEGIFIQTAGNFAYLNTAAMRMFGATTPDQLIGSPVLEHVHPEFRKLVSERIRMLNKELEAVPLIEEKMLRLDGTSFDAEISAVPFVYAHRHGALVFMRDITGRKLANKERTGLEKQLFQSQKLESIGRLAGGVAHDLNNLLTPILGYSEILAQKFDPKDSRRQQLNVMHDAALKARDLIRQLLAFSSSQSLEFRVIDLNAVVRGFGSLLRRTIRANVAITYHLDDKVLSMIGDAGQIEQIIMNLAINADDSMHSGGNLTIETSLTVVDPGGEALFEGVPVGRYVMLSISDNGTGMDSETLSHVFEPFFTTKPKGKGTGLGLSIVYGIVKQHGGYIKVSSEPGRGSCFRIWFPLRAGEVGALMAEKVSAAQGPSSGTVLVVEDDEQVRQLVEQALQHEGFEVQSAASGEEAFEMLEGGDYVPDLLLTDLVMKGINGRELSEKALVLLPGLKVLYMSGYTKSIITTSGEKGSGVSFLQKPFTVHALTQKVREMVNS
ncbi:MAG: PAS domain S-box protein [Chlorobiaceae bacterium]|nr:PAS domain S-box protein [Chlorobiaceae bacterium]